MKGIGASCGCGIMDWFAISATLLQNSSQVSNVNVNVSLINFYNQFGTQFVCKNTSVQKIRLKNQLGTRVQSMFNAWRRRI